jgi:hypothetical protein
MFGKILKHIVKTQDLILQRWQRIGLVSTANEKSAGIAQHARHMTNEFRGSAYSLGSTEGTEVARGIPQRFLCAIGKGGQEVSQEGSFLVHLTPFF